MDMRVKLTASVLALWGMATAAGCASDGDVERGAAGLSSLDAAVANARMAADAAPRLDRSSNRACSDSAAYIGGGPYKFAGGTGPFFHGTNIVDATTYGRFGGGKATLACTSPLPACDSSGVDTAELGAAFANPDVVAAFAEAPSRIHYIGDDLTLELVFGTDNQALFQIFDGHDKIFKVGPPCLGAVECRDIPPGVAALVTLLEQLDHEQGLSGPCARFLEEEDTDISLDGGTIPDSSTCVGLGDYTAAKGKGPAPCCPGYNEYQLDYRPCSMLGIAAGHYACILGTCGDGICEDPENVSCGCAADCLVTAYDAGL